MNVKAFLSLGLTYLLSTQLLAQHQVSTFEDSSRYVLNSFKFNAPTGVYVSVASTDIYLADYSENRIKNGTTNSSDNTGVLETQELNSSLYLIPVTSSIKIYNSNLNYHNVLINHLIGKEFLHFDQCQHISLKSLTSLIRIY